MEKGILGIGLLLFAILLEMCSSGLDIISLGIGLVGMIVLFISALQKK